MEKFIDIALVNGGRESVVEWKGDAKPGNENSVKNVVNIYYNG